MYNKPIVADSFDVPLLLETDRCRLRPLVIDDVELDYDAVMTSAERLKTIFRPGGNWPDGLTLDQNRIELGWHQVEFQSRTSFAYTVVALDESQVLGCMYIYPSFRENHDVEVTLWVRESEAGTALDDHLFETVFKWIASDWPFENPVYPGRTVSWDSWSTGE